MKNRYFKIFSLAAGMFFLNNTEGMEAEKSLSNTLKNIEQEIKSWAGIKSQTEEPGPFYENSPPVRNYMSEYAEKFRDYYGNKEVVLINGYIVKTYFRLLATTTLDQQWPLFAIMEALILMLVQSQFREVQVIRQLLDDKCYQRLEERWLEAANSDFKGDIFGSAKANLDFLRIGQDICKVYSGLCDLFQQRVTVNDNCQRELIDSCINENYKSLQALLRSWKDKNISRGFIFGSKSFSVAEKSGCAFILPGFLP